MASPGSEPGAPPGSDRCPRCGDPVELDASRRLALRHSGPADAAGIEALHRRLGPDDLRRRFFTPAVPSPAFFGRWAAIESEGGFGLVAALTAPGGERLAAEAGYAPVPESDDGELGVVVDPHLRGWLGPWILDRLLAHAAQRGIRNLRALVLIENRAMLALAARRGYAILGRPDWNTVLVTMSTAGSVPSWGGDHRRPRVLIEAARSRSSLEQPLREAGFDVALCNGPCRSGRTCPVLRGERCPLIDGSDVVVVDLPPDDPVTTGLLRAERVVHPGLLPVAVVEEHRAGDGAPRRLPPGQVVARVRGLLGVTDDRGPDEDPTG